MATYSELLQAAENDALRQKIRVAVIIAAEAIRIEVDTTANHAARLVWAAATFRNPVVEADRMLWAVLAQNKDATFAQIIGATDAQVQAAVNGAVNVFAV